MKKLYILLIILFSVVIIYGLIVFTNEHTKKKTKEDEYQGIITKIYQDEWNHNVYTFVINTGYNVFEENAEIWSYSRKYATVGDSIIKPKDELYIIIKKSNGESKTFYYQ